MESLCLGEVGGEGIVGQRGFLVTTLGKPVRVEEVLSMALA